MSCPTCGQESTACTCQTEEQKKPPKDLVMEGFNSRADKPSAEVIERWKDLHGEVFLFALDEDEMYIWRPLRRLEYKTLRTQAKEDSDFMEAVVSKCVLWPPLPPEFMAVCKAGTIDTFFEVIMQGSNFIDPQVAVNLLVRRL